MQVHLIYTRGGVFLSKRPYASWREIQDEVEDFMTSLGPWEADAVVDYLDGEYPDIEPAARAQVDALLEGASDTVEVTFRPDHQ